MKKKRQKTQINRIKNEKGEGLVQDGGVEGRALTPSFESSGMTTNC